MKYSISEGKKVFLGSFLEWGVVFRDELSLDRFRPFLAKMAKKDHFGGLGWDGLSFIGQGNTLVSLRD